MIKYLVEIVQTESEYMNVSNPIQVLWYFLGDVQRYSVPQHASGYSLGQVLHPDSFFFLTLAAVVSTGSGDATSLAGTRR